jgi:hypothetical protein
LFLNLEFILLVCFLLVCLFISPHWFLWCY